MASFDYDVLIIGAGAAGLSAGYALREKGVSVAVLEARNWIGGRVWTQELHNIELGAEFIHGRNDPMWKIIRDAHLVPYDVKDEHAFFKAEHFEKQENFWEDLEKALKKARSHRKQDRSFREFIQSAWLKRELKDLVISFVEGFDAAPIDDISEQSVAESQPFLEKAEGLYRLLGGYDELMTFLAASIREVEALYLNTRVRAIRWQHSSVDVETETSEGEKHHFHAKHVIVTVPIGVLQKRDIRFEPDVFDEKTSKGKALKLLRPGAVTKVILEFDQAFWEESDRYPKLGFVHSRELDLPTWWGALPLHVPILTGWAGGPASQKLAGINDEQLLDRALTSLAQLLGLTTELLRSHLKSFHSHDWQSDPFSRGAYSYAAVGGAHAPADLALPVNDTLFFAGEATHTEGLSGTVDGAVATGQRAAQEVLRVLAAAKPRKAAA